MAQVKEPASQAEELPSPDARLVLWRVSMQALLATMPRKRGEKMLRVMAEVLATEQSVSELMPIRPPSDHDAVQRARRGALAQFRATLPVFLAMMDRE